MSDQANTTEPLSFDATEQTALAIRFLDNLHQAGPWHLVAIVPDGAVTARAFDAKDRNEMRQFILSRLGRANLYVHVNPLAPGRRDLKAKKADISVVEYLHVDIDDLSGIERLRNFRIPPTCIVASGGGFNAYWRLVTPLLDSERAEDANRWLVSELGGDRAATDVSRILRIPGTINLPTKTKLARGRTPSLSSLVEEETYWARAYEAVRFGSIPQDTGKAHVPENHRPKANILPCTVPVTVETWLQTLAIHGDDPVRPRGSKDQRYRSRSETIWALACGLAREDIDEQTIAGILINPAYRISESILEKRHPVVEACRQAAKAGLAVGTVWPDGVVEGTTNPRRNFQNTQTALLRLGIIFWFDRFRQRHFVSGQPIQAFQGEINDRACLQLRDMINKAFGFDPGKDMTRDAVEQLCNQNTIDPVCEYLDELIWDGNSRIEDWLIRLAGADDTPFVRAVGTITFIAAVRRARSPGVKFDTITVLEGVQGSGKSTLLKILASEEFFSDQDILVLDYKAQMEALEGIWIFELCELAGIRYADVNKLKAFVSRATDRARPAYGRYTEARKRRGILIGTTNDDEYLKDETGNRRFWPIRTGRIDLDAIARERDQLWAEAAAREAKGESIVLPSELWITAQIEQQKRVEADGWEVTLGELRGMAFNGREIAESSWLMHDILKIQPGHVMQYHWRRLKKAMTALGWEGPITLSLPSGGKAKGYWKPTDRANDQIGGGRP